MTDNILVVDVEAQSLATKIDPDVPMWMVGLVTEKWQTACTDMEQAKGIIKDHLSAGWELVFHNASYDVPTLRLRGFDIPAGSYHDTMIMSWLLDSGRKQRGLSHSLKSWGEELSFPKGDFTDFTGPADCDIHAAFGVKPTPHEFEIDCIARKLWLERMSTYCKQDCAITYKLYHMFMRRLRQEPKLLDLYHNVEMPFVESVIQCEQTGFYLDLKKTKRLLTHNTKRVERVTDAARKVYYYCPSAQKPKKLGTVLGTVPNPEPPKLRKKVLPDGNVIYTPPKSYKRDIKVRGCGIDLFNPGSGDQLAQALIELYGWEPKARSKAGNIKTSKEVLEDLTYPLVDIVKCYRDGEKIAAFLSSFLANTDKYGILRGNFNQTGTRTGRLSSSEPNLQNIDGRLKSLVVVPPNGKLKLVLGDLSNIEGRVLAYYLEVVMNDSYLADVFRSGADFHQANADRLGVARRIAKTWLYASLYGALAPKIAATLRISVKEAEEICELAERMFPSLSALKKAVFAQARKRGGTIYTKFGRRLHYPDICSNNKWRRQRAERQLFNALLQGTAADILKILCVRSQPAIKQYRSALAAQVHDEAVIYSPSSEADELASTMTSIWSCTDLLGNVPVVGEFFTSDYWKH